MNAKELYMLRKAKEGPKSREREAMMLLFLLTFPFLLWSHLRARSYTVIFKRGPSD